MKRIFTQSAIALIMGAMVLMSSCSKKDDNISCGSPSSGTDQAKTARIQQMLKKLPLTRITDIAGRYAQQKLKKNSLNRGGDGWSFTDPTGGGWNFSDPSGISYTTTTNTIFIPYSSFGSNSVGGTVVAGGSTLDINYTFCFSADDAALGLNLYDLNGNAFTGLSLVLGVSGDFDELAEADSTSDLFDFFHGLAFYVVYDSPADGDYEVVDWLGGLSNYNIDSKVSFAFIFDFRDGKLYMSSSGTINVDGGTMDYNGEYLEIAGFFDEDGDFDWDELSYSIVPGFGAMGCD